MITEHKNNKYCCDMLLVPVRVNLVMLRGNTCYVILVNAIHMLMHFDDWSSVSVRQDVLHQQHLRMQVSHRLCRH
jgi:hypothetical protein